jgi:NTE family protein
LRRRKIGLALGGGAARGLAHIGVLAVLEKEGIPIDMIAGTSAGAAVGALYAQGKDASQIKDLAIKMGRMQFLSLVDLALPRSGFIEGTRIKNLLKSIIGDIKFSDLRIPLACVATDIRSGEELVISQGSVLEAVRASISVPVIFTAVKWQDRYLVDGGLVNPVPVKTVREMGADFIIAVNVMPHIGDRTQRAKKSKQPGMFQVMLQSIYIATYSLVKSSLERADIVIEPQLTNIGYGDFRHIRECISQGELAAQESIPKIKKQLGG